MQFIPILKMVYEAMEGKVNYLHVYILLVILLLFSRDDLFNENIQKIVSFTFTIGHVQRSYYSRFRF